MAQVVAFRDRREAGRRLADDLSGYTGRHDVVVLALPRGGVPVGYEVAQALGVPLDVFLVRKVGVPGHAELAMGAIATGGVMVRNQSVIDALRISERDIDAVAAREGEELERREGAYRDGRPAPDVAGKTVILVDDGLATGASMKAAVRAVRALKPAAVVVAVPTAAPPSVAEMRAEADEVVCPLMPESFMAVGQWYHDFSPTTDEEVRQLLADAAGG